MELDGAGTAPELQRAMPIQESGSVWPRELVVNVDGDTGTEELYVAGEFGMFGLNSPLEAVIGGQVLEATRFWEGFVAKFEPENPDEPVAWALQIAPYAGRKKVSNLTMTADALARSADGGIYVGGEFRGTRNFGPAVLTDTDGACYMLRIDENTSGQPEVTWVSQFGSSGGSEASAIGVLDSSTLYVAGSFDGLANFDPDGVPVERTSVDGSRDLYLLQLDAQTGDYLSVQLAGVAGDERATDLVVTDVVNLLGRFTSPLVPTMGGTMELNGEQDAMLIHVNPALPQLSIEPPVTQFSEEQTQTFTALDSGEPVEVEWVLVPRNPSVGPTVAAGTTFTLPVLPVGRYELTATMAGASYRHLFDVVSAPSTSAAPSDLTADVVVAGIKSTITLSWTDNSDSEDGFIVEYSNVKLTSGWQPLGTVGPNTTTFVHSRISNKVGIIQYRVRSFVVVAGETIVSDPSNELPVDPTVSGPVAGALTFNSWGDIAAAIDLALLDDEIFSPASSAPQ